MDQQPSTPNEQPVPMAPPAAMPEQSSPGKHHVPTGNWEGAFGIYKYSRDAIRANLGTFLGLIGIFLLANIVVSTIFSNSILLNNLLQTILSVYFTLFSIGFYLATVRGEKVALGDIIQRYTSPMWAVKIFLLSMLLSLILFASLIMLIVPFFFVLPRLVLAQYFLVDKNLDVLEAIAASWEATKGHSMKVWGIFGVILLILLIVLTIIGIPIMLYLLVMYSAALAVLYEFVNRTPVEQS